MTLQYNLAPNPNWQEWQNFTIESSPNPYEFTANTSTNVITTDGNPRYFTGKMVLVMSTGGLPAPLTSGVPYYIIFVSSTSFKLATTYDNAINNVAIDITTSGTGTLTIVSGGSVYLQPLTNGKMYTYSSIDHTLAKATYRDTEGHVANENPIIFNNYGQANIYWVVNLEDGADNYYYEVYNAAGTLIYAIDKFNAPPMVVSNPASLVDARNFIRNPMFTYWPLYDYDNIDVSCNASAASGSLEIANEWFFEKSNTHATDIITRETFDPGQTEVPFDPVYFMTVACTNSGAGGETFKRFYQPYENVQTFSGQDIFVMIYAKCANGDQETMSINAIQDFGSGGSSAVNIVGKTISLNDSFQLFTVTLNIPSIAGKSIGTDSQLKITFDMPLNAAYSISFASSNGFISDQLEAFNQLTLEQQKQTLTTLGITGDIQIHPNLTNIPRQWIELADGTIGNASSGGTLRASEDTKSLFLFLWDNFIDGWCPVYDATGAKVVRGGTALADFNANKRIRPFFNSGRSIANKGAPVNQYTFTVNTGTNILTLSGTSPQYTLYAGKNITVFSTGTLPAPLAAATTYYIIPVSDTTYKLAATQAEALAGTPVIDITTAGTGIHTLQWLGDGISAGDATGETLHVQTEDELAAHKHAPEDGNQFGTTGSPGGFEGGGGGAYVSFTTTVGSNTPFNVIQPTLWLPHIIKL